MIPKTLSASSILVAEGCMERWKVENFWRTPQMGSEPANIGTACHFALEHFVQDTLIDGKYGWDNVAQLKAYYDIGYVETFGSTDFSTPAYKDGAKLIANWYERHKGGIDATVLSCEIKESFDVKTSAGPIKFNFIWDRADQIGEDEYEIVDYKTLRAFVNTDDLREKIQPRAYGLAGQIKWPNAKRIWVTFDMLRHNESVSVCYSREDNIATYRRIQRAAERIIGFDEDETPETINPECKWCIKKSTCETLLRSAQGGSVHSMGIEEIVERYDEMRNRVQALQYAQEELERAIFAEAEQRDEFEFSVGDYEIGFGQSSRRSVTNAHAISQIVGPELSARYGNFTVGSVDEMLKSGDVTDEQAKQVKKYVQAKFGEPKAKIKKKTED